MKAEIGNDEICTTEARSGAVLIHKALTEAVLAAAFEVHSRMGPGLLESVYEECLCHELHLRRIPFTRQVPIPIEYKGIKLDGNLLLDILIDDAVVLELKSVESILPVHEAQLITYLKLSNKKVGLLINFNVDSLKDGILRRVL
jgi:GxxExxY protein